MGASIVDGEGNLASYPGRSLKKKINGQDTRLRVTRNAAFLDMYNVQKYNIELYLNARLFICLYSSSLYLPWSALFVGICKSITYAG